MEILNTELFIINMQTRLPFKFGISTMTAVPHLILKVTLSIDGKKGVGYAADHLPPKWFTKTPDATLQKEVDDMIAVIRQACDIAESCPPSDTVFSHWYRIYTEQREWAGGTIFPALLWGFGVSLLERALIDSFCRLTLINFSDAVRKNALGIDFGVIYPELKGMVPADVVPVSPVEKIQIRHTIGLSDPITDADISTQDRLNDGLPQSLESIIHTYGITYFKIKLSGNIQTDTERLNDIAEVFERNRIEFSYTLDGNENYHDMTSFRQLWQNITANKRLTIFLSRLIFIEQPFHRDIALTDQIRYGLSEWPGHPDIIIDESDGGIGDIKKAIELGYAGTSYKNCKGFFKGFANAAYLHHLSHANPDKSYILSSEDLSTVGPVSLLQDLAVLATLGVPHTERNGHHYFKGLSMFPETVQQSVLENHGDLYTRHGDGYPMLNIRNGAIQLKSIIQSPFGMGFELDTSKFIPLADWRYDQLED